MFSSKSMTPIDRDLSKRVVKIIHGLLMMDQSAAFRKPVPHKALGLQDYKLIVKKPTDLNLIRRQYNEGKYKFVEQILDQIQLCWDNCKLYNAFDSEIYEQALYLEKNFDKLGIEILPEFWKDINRQQYNSKFNERKLQDEKLKKPQTKGGVKKERIVPQQQYLSEQVKSKPKKANHSHSKNSFDPQLYMEEEIQLKKEVRQSNPVEQNENEVLEHNAYSHQNHEKDSMEVQGGQQGNEVTVDPILVNLNQFPTKEQLVELTDRLSAAYQNGESGLVEKVLQILHLNEKENMALNKSGVMTFRMNRIHVSTYLRIRKVVIQQQGVALIQ